MQHSNVLTIGRLTAQDKNFFIQTCLQVVSYVLQNSTTVEISNYVKIPAEDVNRTAIVPFWREILQTVACRAQLKIKRRLRKQ